MTFQPLRRCVGVPLCAAMAAVSSCGLWRPSTREPARVAPIPATLPPLPPGISPPGAVTPPTEAQSGQTAAAKRVTLTAVDADVRSLLIAIAREGGINLVVSNDVRRRISVSFRDATPEDALRAVIAEAGLTVVEPEAGQPWPPVVYYQLPVNINDAPAEAIAARFGISAELARWIVESRLARPGRQP